MPQVDAVKSPKRKRVVTAAIVVPIAAVVVILGAAWLVWYLHRPTIANVDSQADSLDMAGQYSQAYSKLTAVYPRAHSTADRIAVISRLGATAQDENNNQEAVVWDEKLEQLQPTDITTLESLGSLQDQLGQKSAAIATYKQLVNVLDTKKSDMMANAEIQQLQGRIQELEQ